MRRRLSALLTLLLTGALMVLGAPVQADHTDPREPLAPTDGVDPPGFRTEGAGRWKFIRNFPANPGSDLEFFRHKRQLYSATGTLGQATEAHVGQRILRLIDRLGRVRPRWRADHGSAHCGTANPSGTLGLQHDSQVTGFRNPDLLIDTTDATGRCHDSGANGGGLELIDISRIGNRAFKPREIALTRHGNFSHTHTVDATRPWIVYNSSSAFANFPWIDVLDIRSCLGLRRMTLAEKRDQCRPKVYRIPFEPNWSRQRNWYDGELRPGSEAACHDITATPSRLYCASLNATLIFDVSNLTKANGAIRGIRLDCPVVDGTNTEAKVTDCSAVGPGTEEDPTPQARGWEFLGRFNHPGRDCVPPPGNNQSCNSNLFVPPDEGISVAHEADPIGRRWMLVTDERGGGVVPPGASCDEGVDNPQGNGGLHVFDISRTRNIRYARTPDGEKAVWRSEILTSSPTFCDIHVIEKIPGEQRLIVAYYSSGTKIVDYFIDDRGRWTFQETASLILPQANTWAVEDFRIRNNPNGTRTYWFLANDIQRGIDVFKWRGPTNRPAQARAVARSMAAASSRPSGGTADRALILLAVAGLPAAALLGRRRRRRLPIDD
jgi:hypothetical protein